MSYLNISEEEADEEIERMQQQLTLALQEIDENFAYCNQSASKLSADIDRFGEASELMRNNNQKWLYFLQTMLYQNIGPMSDNGTESGSTNRPVIDDDTSKLLGQQHDMTNGALTNFLRRSLRHTDHSPIDTTFSGPTNPLRYHSPSTLSDTSSNRIRMSPPRTVPFGYTSEQLQGTPIREQALMLTENRLRSLGAHTDSDTDSGPFSIDHSDNSRLTTRPREGKKRVNEEDNNRDRNERSKFNTRPWEVSNMDSDDTESRENLVKFLKGRNVLDTFKQPYLPGTTANKRFRPEIEVEQDLIGSNRSSSFRSEQQQPQEEEEEEEAVVSPLSSSRQQENIRFSPRFSSEEIQSPRYRPEVIQSPRFQGTESSISSRFQAVTPLAMQEQEQEVEAYEFSDGLLPYGSAYNETRMHTTDTTTNSTTSRQSSITSTSSSIPRKFELKYFSEQFRNPPNSLKLTKIYNEFNKRPGTLLTIEDVMNFLDDTSFTIEFVSLSIGILTRKRFLRMVGDKGDAWVIRR